MNRADERSYRVSWRNGHWAITDPDGAHMVAMTYQAAVEAARIRARAEQVDLACYDGLGRLEVWSSYRPTRRGAWAARLRQALTGRPATAPAAEAERSAETVRARSAGPGWQRQAR